MKPEYQRENLKITEFDTEDVIATSGIVPIEDPTSPEAHLSERENAYGSFDSFDSAPGSWF